jgi:hypothetical protein
MRRRRRKKRRKELIFKSDQQNKKHRQNAFFNLSDILDDLTKEESIMKLKI